MSSAPQVEFHPYDQAFSADPYPAYARLRERTPIFFAAEPGMTLFTRYRDIRRLLADRRLGRTMDHLLRPEDIERKRRTEHWDRLPWYSRYVRVNLLETEGEDHSRLRRLISTALNPARIPGLRQRIREIVEELLAELLPRRAMDFIGELAVPLPVHVISELLGWPAEEHQRLRPWSAAIVRLYEKDHTAEDELRAEAATRDFAGMLDELAAARLARPRADLISALASVQERGQGLTRDELIATCMLLLNAGHEATVNAAGNGLLALLRHPRQMGRLCEDPLLITSAVEEMLRYDSPLQLFHRFVLEDMEYEQVELDRGEMVGLLYGSANRDPEAFDRPDQFDVGRQPNRHLAFGSGTHFCLGAPLARLELEILFDGLLRRVPAIELAAARPEYRTGLVFRGLKELRVRW